VSPRLASGFPFLCKKKGGEGEVEARGSFDQLRTDYPF
jgi:hypothetical protein